MDVFEAILTRRSIRRYTPQPIPDTLMEQILQAAIWSPSAHNRQPFRFMVIRTQATKEQLARAMGAQLRHDLTRDGAPIDLIEQDVNRSYERITQAPALILLALSMVDMDSYTDPTRNQHERTMAVQSSAMAGQNILLAAHALGLGACWMCAPLFCAAVVKSVLELPIDWEPQALIALGFPAQTREKTRHPLEKSVLWR
ncbi:MAG: nitroreductase family protein [Phototrophicaceae bacterium]|jgi:F420 biosynthesis protein FbiB-like protein